MKTVAELEALPDYTVVQTYLARGSLFIAYRSPNGLWWSNLGYDDRHSLEEIMEFVAIDQPETWPGWVVLSPDPDRTLVHSIVVELQDTNSARKKGPAWVEQWLDRPRGGGWRDGEGNEIPGAPATSSARDLIRAGRGEVVLRTIRKIKARRAAAVRTMIR